VNLAHRIGAVAEQALDVATEKLAGGSTSAAKDAATTMAILVDKAQILTGGATLTSGDAVGFAYPALGTIDPMNVSIELWTKRVNEGNLDSAFPYAWWVLPRAKDMRLGQKSFGNKSVQPTVSGKATENEHWFDGPVNNWTVASDRVMQYMPCTAAKVPAASTSYESVAAS